MDQYIQQLLNQNQRVIVPGFGAFMSSTEGGIVYNQFLNFDDGALSGMVAEKEGVSADEAKQKVQSFVDALKQQLDNGETVSLEGIGTLKRNNESVEFTADSNASTSGILKELADNTGIAYSSLCSLDFEAQKAVTFEYMADSTNMEHIYTITSRALAVIELEYVAKLTGISFDELKALDDRKKEQLCGHYSMNFESSGVNDELVAELKEMVYS